MRLRKNRGASGCRRKARARQYPVEGGRGEGANSFTMDIFSFELNFRVSGFLVLTLLFLSQI